MINIDQRAVHEKLDRLVNSGDANVSQRLPPLMTGLEIQEQLATTFLCHSPDPPFSPLRLPRGCLRLIGPCIASPAAPTATTVSAARPGAAFTGYG